MMIALALRRSDRPRPIGVLAMSPALPGLDVFDAGLGGRRRTSRC